MLAESRILIVEYLPVADGLAVPAATVKHKYKRQLQACRRSYGTGLTIQALQRSSWPCWLFDVYSENDGKNRQTPLQLSCIHG